MAGPFVVARNSVVIDVPARQVFDYLADLSHLSQWIGEVDFRVTSPPERMAGPGALLRREKSGVMRGPLIVRGGMSDNPLRVVKVSTITVYEPYAALAVETRNSYNGLLHSIERFSFEFHPLGPFHGRRGEPEVDGAQVSTQVSMVSEIEPMVPSMYIGPVYAIRLVRSLFERLLRNRLGGLFTQAPAGPQLSRVKEMTESKAIAGSS